MTKWVGEALSKVGKTKCVLSIISSFKKCGLSVGLDGSENDEVNIESLPEYQMLSAFVQDNELYWMMTMNLKKKIKIRVTLKTRKSLKL